MGAVSYLTAFPSEEARAPSLVPPVFLDEIRQVALDCRSAARTDLFRACAVLSTQPQVARTAYIETVMRGLAQALGKAPVTYRPGVAQMSFDEAWISRMILAAQGGDNDSLSFLLRSRLPKTAWRNVASLIRAIAETTN